MVRLLPLLMLQDMLYMNSNNAASDTEDQMLDATKPSGSNFNFHSLSADNQKLALDARPYVGGNTVILP
ncbi:MAG: hypothetical protein H7257_04385 [Taibaiella sp.]|nr:hypothetical protein [Taibaiella sp.]